MGECGQIGGPNGSDWKSAPPPSSPAPTARRHTDGMSLLYTVLYMGPLAPSVGRVPLCGCQFAKETMRHHKPTQSICAKQQPFNPNQDTLDFHQNQTELGKHVRHRTHKKQHSLIESVALKELLYCSSTPYAISRRWRRVSTNAGVKSYASITALISP